MNLEERILKYLRIVVAINAAFWLTAAPFLGSDSEWIDTKAPQFFDSDTPSITPFQGKCLIIGIVSLISIGFI